jgi:hypothetical protein
MTYSEFQQQIQNGNVRLKDSSLQIAYKLGISEEDVINFRKQYRENKLSQNKEIVVKVSLNDLDTTPSIEDLEASGYAVKSSVVPPIAPKGFTVSSFQDNKVWYKKDENANIAQDIDWTSIVPKPYKLSTYKEKDRTCLQIIFPTDSHLNRMELSGRTIDEKCKEVIDKTIEAVELAKKLYSVDTIVYITGSDMFNSTGKTPFTVKGTLQETQGTYNVGFEKIVDMNVTIIDFLYENCKNLNVYSVLGNHDEVECYMLGKYLQAYYRTFPIKFEVEKKYRKYFEFGNNGFMMHHGNVSKFEQLTQAFSNESPEIFCKKYPTLITGDKHYLKITQIGRVVVRQYPALAQVDTWSDEMAYNSTGFISDIFDKEKGHLLTIDLK